jgi:hypothetical protein
VFEGVGRNFPNPLTDKAGIPVDWPEKAGAAVGSGRMSFGASLRIARERAVGQDASERAPRPPNRLGFLATLLSWYACGDFRPSFCPVAHPGLFKPRAHRPRQRWAETESRNQPGPAVVIIVVGAIRAVDPPQPP